VWEVCSFNLNNSTYSLPVFNYTLEDIWPHLTLHYSRIANISGWGKLTSPNMGNNNNLSPRKHSVCWYLIQINDPSFIRAVCLCLKTLVFFIASTWSVFGGWNLHQSEIEFHTYQKICAWCFNKSVSQINSKLSSNARGKLHYFHDKSTNHINIPPPVTLTNYYIYGSMKMKDQFHKHPIPFLN